MNTYEKKAKLYRTYFFERKGIHIVETGFVLSCWIRVVEALREYGFEKLEYQFSKHYIFSKFLTQVKPSIEV